ncbi:MAG: exonuclease [Myxococcota bacterium]|nr:exonuclease [Myxococcota bacterium]
MSYFMIDIETDGPIPHDYSMICFGAVVVEPSLTKRFYGKLRPISDRWLPDALAISGFSRSETLSFPHPKETMLQFVDWIAASTNGRPMFISDNNGFDWQFVNWYLHHFTGQNPFGHSSSNLGSLYKGMVSNCFQTFKHLRKTPHTHNPLDDAIGNAEALLQMKMDMGLKISLQ